jgi:hypothetical protein
MLGQAAVVSALLAVMTLETATPLPEGFARVPAEVRVRATVVVMGTFTSGRGPCEFLPDGSRRWPLLRGFETGAVYRGTVRADYIGVVDPVATGPAGEAIPLVEGASYLLLLRPSERSSRMLDEPTGSRNPRDALPAEDVVAIVEP